MPDQWRNCSDRYYPVATFPQSTPYSGGPAGSATTTITSSVNPSSNKYQVVARPHKNKKGGIYQSPPRPGLGHTDDFAAARLWPITYLYKDGPPNSTELTISNFVDCKKESDCWGGRRTWMLLKTPELYGIEINLFMHVNHIYFYNVLKDMYWRRSSRRDAVLGCSWGRRMEETTFRAR